MKSSKMTKIKSEETFKAFYKKIYFEGVHGQRTVLETVQILKINEEGGIYQYEFSSKIEQTNRVMDTLPINYKEIRLRIISDTSVESIRAENAVIVHYITNERLDLANVEQRQTLLNDTLDSFTTTSIRTPRSLTHVNTCAISVSSATESVLSAAPLTEVSPFYDRHHLTRSRRSADLIGLHLNAEEYISKTRTFLEITTALFAYSQIISFRIQNLLTVFKFLPYVLCWKYFPLMLNRNQSIDDQTSVHNLDDNSNVNDRSERHAEISTSTCESTADRYSIVDQLNELIYIVLDKQLSQSTVESKLTMHSFELEDSFLHKVLPSTTSQVSGKRISTKEVVSTNGEVPGKSLRIQQEVLNIAQFPRSSDSFSQDPRRSLTFLHQIIFNARYQEFDNIENLSPLNFEEFVDFLSCYYSPLSNLIHGHFRDVILSGHGKCFLGIEFDNKKRIVQMLAEDTGDQQLEPKIRLITVPAEVFENAIRQCQINDYELTFTNYYPRNIRMFIAIPVYKGGLINRRDRKDQR